MNIKDAMHFIAQGTINVAEGTEKVDVGCLGHDGERAKIGSVELLGPKPRGNGRWQATGSFIAQDSLVHKAMGALCELLPPPREHVEVAFRDTRIIDTVNGGFCVKLGFGAGCILATCKTREDAEAVVTCLNTLAAHLSNET